MMAFIGFCFLLIIGFLLVAVGVITFLACVALGSKGGECLFGMLLAGVGVGLWWLAAHHAPFSVVFN
ncbi:hypothetical protein [Pseudomonas lini]